MEFNWKGTTHDFEGYNKTVKQRWTEDGKTKTVHCLTHNTFFIPDEEPCWQCWNEFEINK